jgi:hypothetical protein
VIVYTGLYPLLIAFEKRFRIVMIEFPFEKYLIAVIALAD